MAAHRYWRLNLLGSASSPFSASETQFRTTPGTPLLFSGGTASASSSYSSSTNPPTSLTDNNINTWWAANTNNAGEWWEYDYGVGNAFDIKEVTLTSRNDTSFPQTPTVFALQYSDNNTVWFNLAEFAATTWSQGQTQTFDVPSPAAGTIAVDPGSPISSITHGTNTQTLTITTSAACSFVVLVSFCGGTGGGAAPISTLVSGGGLAWTMRARSNSSLTGCMEVWSALPSAALSAVAITVTYAANFDCATLAAFGVQNVNAVTPWDSNASLPKKASYGGYGITPSFSGITTSGANGMALFAVANTENWTPPGTPPSGYTLLITATNGGGILWAQYADTYNQFSSALSGYSIAWGAPIDFSHNGGEGIFDVIDGPSISVAAPVGRAYITTASRAGIPSAAVWSTTTNSYMLPLSVALSKAAASAPSGGGGSSSVRVVVMA